jgi:7-cyano-7-deazaguanine synthase in queuosine biosynthesis
MEHTEKIRIVLVSGGVDSYASWVLCQDCPSGYKNIPVFINYKGAYTHKEQRICEQIYGKELVVLSDVVDLGQFEKGIDAYIPNRNIFLIASALLRFPEAEEVILSGNKDDTALDKTEKALEALSNTFSTTTGHVVKISSPWIDATKAEIVENTLLYNENAESVLLQTTSCYHPSEPWCGECKACFRRYAAFLENNIHDPKMPVFNGKDVVQYYRTKIITRTSLTPEKTEYTEERKNSIKKTILHLEKEYAKREAKFPCTSLPLWVYQNCKKRAELKEAVFFDIDGTLTYEVAGFNTLSYKRRTCQSEVATGLRELYNKGHEIVLFTARRKEDVEETVEWLSKHNIPFDSIIFNKPKYQMMVDDMSKHPETFLKEQKD